jgi:hypothetical protein
LKDAIPLPNGLRIVTPEWLAILKIIAGRQKDFDDGAFLLKRPKLVNCLTIKQKMIETGGGGARLIMRLSRGQPLAHARGTVPMSLLQKNSFDMSMSPNLVRRTDRARV